jgi:hypothetical protein
MYQRLPTRQANATTASPKMIIAGRVTWSGAPPNTASIAALESQSMRFSANWKIASKTAPERYAGRCLLN